MFIMSKKIQLPLGINDFTTIREDNFIYIDKTYYLQKLIENGNRYFLSAPSGFGKSLLLSTLTAMFSGKKNYFIIFLDMI